MKINNNSKVEDVVATANVDHYICPISHEIMKDPVICSDGITYDRENITRWLETHDTSPKTNAHLISKSLIPNYALKLGIENHLATTSAATASTASTVVQNGSSKRKHDDTKTEDDESPEEVLTASHRSRRHKKVSNNIVCCSDAGFSSTPNFNCNCSGQSPSCRGDHSSARDTCCTSSTNNNASVCEDAGQHHYDRHGTSQGEQSAGHYEPYPRD